MSEKIPVAEFDKKLEPPLPVRITAKKHPHFGCTGTLTGDVMRAPGTGKLMAYCKLDGCAHGLDATYVSTGDFQLDRVRMD